jgi:hypothetical protein
VAEEAGVVEQLAIMSRDNHQFAEFNKIGLVQRGDRLAENLDLAWAAGASPADTALIAAGCKWVTPTLAFPLTWAGRLPEAETKPPLGAALVRGLIRVRVPLEQLSRHEGADHSRVLDAVQQASVVISRCLEDHIIYPHKIVTIDVLHRFLKLGGS